MLVSAGSWLMYPKSFIYFGVLHGMAAMLIIVRFTAHWGAWLWCLGALMIAIKFISVYAITMWASAGIIGIFNSPALNWLGLVTRNPVTEDYVPLLPWLGVMWWGVAAGTWLATRKTGLFLRPAAGVFKPLAVLGRWSLTYYMLHQPIMIGGLMALGWLIR